jgi:tRNA threonylcarbamoyladenosine biosynthesis protein TsaB
LILCIESSTSVCSVALADGNELVAASEVHIGFSHAELLTVLIEQLLQRAKIAPKNLSAIAISAGPGSYTGLRIGTSTAKGIALALGLPLVAVPTLQIMSAQVATFAPAEALLLPMLDARRMEVYTAAYTADLEEIEAAHPLVLTEEAEADKVHKLIEGQPAYIFGNGSNKAAEFFAEARFVDNVHPLAKYMPKLAQQQLEQGQLADLAYFEPSYLKPVEANKAKIVFGS